jgi:hypothetical protein
MFLYELYYVNEYRNWYAITSLNCGVLRGGNCKSHILRTHAYMSTPEANDGRASTSMVYMPS